MIAAGATNGRRGILDRWSAIPLYWRILVAMMLGIVFGLILRDRAAFLEIPSKVILQLLGALAPPLILVAVTHVLMTSNITARIAARLAGLLLLNTLVAILIGLTVANLLQPGTYRVSVSAPGFQAFSVSDIQLSAGDRRRIVRPG